MGVLDRGGDHQIVKGERAVLGVNFGGPLVTNGGICCIVVWKCVNRSSCFWH